MDLLFYNVIIGLLCELVASSSIGSSDFFLHSPSQHIWSRVANGSIPTESLTASCASQLTAISSAINSGLVWPYRFIDASGHLPPGFLDGTLSSLGDYDQCLAIKSDGDKIIHGSYCMVKFTKLRGGKYSTPVQEEIADGLFLYDAIPLSLGICLPDACTDEHDIRSLLSSFSPLSQVSRGHKIICDSSKSDSERLYSFSFSQIIASVYLVCLYVLLVLGTLSHQFKWSRNEFLLCFSVKRSVYRLIKPPEGRNTIVDDVRWFMAFVVTIVHSFACATEMRVIVKISRLKVDFWNKFHWFSAQPYFNVIGIDGFFAIAGLATVWSVSKNIKEGSMIKSAFKILLSRWLRFGPPLITLLAIEMIWPKFGSGPLYTELTSYIYESCESTWWMTVLGINNIGMDPSSTCLVHTWYLSAEFQLFILAIIALILLQRHPAIGKVYCATMILIGMIVPAVKAYYGHIPAATIYHKSFDDINGFIREMYFPAYCHLTPFFIGLITSIAIQEGKLNLQLARSYKKTLICLFIGFVITVYFPAYWNTFKQPLETTSSVIYSLLHRLSFTLGLLSAIALSLMVKEAVVSLSKSLYTSVNINNNVTHNSNGTSSPLKSSSVAMKNMRIVFKCTSQLYFSLYLTHAIFIRYHFFTSRSLFIFDTHWNIVRAGYCFTFAMQLALLFFLAVERPSEELRLLLLGRKRKVE